MLRSSRDHESLRQKQLYITRDEEKVVFTGEPRAMDGDNVVTGTTIIYFMDH